MQNQNDLYHTGVKGMRWGHRKAEKTAMRVEKKIQKAETKWEKESTDQQAYLKIYNHAADKINKQIDTFNSKWKNVNFNDPKLAAYNKRYENAYGRLWDKMLNQSVSELITVSPSGNKRVAVFTEEPGGFPQLKIEDTN